MIGAPLSAQELGQPPGLIRSWVRQEKAAGRLIERRVHAEPSKSAKRRAVFYRLPQTIPIEESDMTTTPALLLEAAAALDRNAARQRRTQTTSADRDAWASPAARAEYQHDVAIARGLRAAAQQMSVGNDNRSAA